MEKKFRVWWIPQVGEISEPFYVPVQSEEDGKKVMTILAAYDAYQLQHNIKPDYCNSGGIQLYDPNVADWVDYDSEIEDEYSEDGDEYSDPEEIESFKEEMFNQIDWKKIKEMTK